MGIIAAPRTETLNHSSVIITNPEGTFWSTPYVLQLPALLQNDVIMAFADSQCANTLEHTEFVSSVLLTPSIVPPEQSDIPGSYYVVTAAGYNVYQTTHYYQENRGGSFVVPAAMSAGGFLQYRVRARSYLAVSGSAANFVAGRGFLSCVVHRN